MFSLVHDCFSHDSLLWLHRRSSMTHSSNFGTNDSVQLSPSFPIYPTVPMMSKGISSFIAFVLSAWLIFPVSHNLFPMAVQLCSPRLHIMTHTFYKLPATTSSLHHLLSCYESTFHVYKGQSCPSSVSESLIYILDFTLSLTSQYCWTQPPDLTESGVSNSHF